MTAMHTITSIIVPQKMKLKQIFGYVLFSYLYHDSTYSVDGICKDNNSISKRLRIILVSQVLRK